VAAPTRYDREVAARRRQGWMEAFKKSIVDMAGVACHLNKEEKPGWQFAFPNVT
jgi:hypothetical protein